MKQKKIILANSVGIDSAGSAIIHSPSRWSNSSKNKNVFTYYPWELAYASTLLKRETDHHVKLIDGCLHKYDHASYLDVLLDESPDYIVMESSTRTWEDDIRLATALKEKCGAQIIIAGQHAIAYPDEVSRQADYVLIGEYEMTLLDIFRGVARENITGLFPNPRRELLDVNFLPLPEDEDVSRFAYAIPGEPSSEYIEIQAYATRGCPFHCAFCVAGTMYYDGKPSWRCRHVQNIIGELQYLKNKYPRMEGIFFDEEYHNVNKSFILQLCREIKANKLHDLKIDAMCAYATLDREMMEAMKDAGYYLLRIGIETGASQAASHINLGAKHNVAKLKQVLKDAKDIGLKMYGTFTFGAAGSTKADDEETLKLMDELIQSELLWRFQTSICTPQPGTPYFKWAQEKGYLKSEHMREFDGGNFVVVDYPDYPAQDIFRMYERSQSFFDMALRNRFKHKVYDSCASFAKDVQGIKRILLLRTSRNLQVHEAISAIRTEMPGVSIDILLQTDVEPIYKNDERIERTFVYGSGFLREDNISEALVRELTDRAYDIAFIIYGNSQGQGYEAALDAFEKIPATRRYAMTSEGDIVEPKKLETLNSK